MENEGAVKVICGEKVEECICTLTVNHLRFHHCKCGGEWLWNEDDERFIVNAWPGTAEDWMDNAGV